MDSALEFCYRTFPRSAEQFILIVSIRVILLNPETGIGSGNLRLAVGKLRLIHQQIFHNKESKHPTPAFPEFSASLRPVPVTFSVHS